jgi:hypothetical protein
VKRPGSGAFRHGFVVSANSAPLELAGWDGCSVGPRFRAWLHPALRRASATVGSVSVLVVGEVVDLDAPSRSADGIAHDLAAAAGRSSSFDGVVRKAAYLGGRFACFVGEGDRLWVIPDCHASQAIFWAGQGHDVVASSHVHLLAEVAGLNPDQRAIELFARAKQMRTKGTLFYPGIVTPFEGALPVLPNHALAVTASSTRHERFYPFNDTEVGHLSEEQAYARFRELFIAHVRQLCGLGRSAIALTAGADSRASFAAALEHLATGSFAFTYNDFERPNPAIIEDLIAANELACRYGVPHRLLPLEDFVPDDDFAAEYVRTFRYTRQFPRLARAFRTQLPSDVYHFLSMLAETGTGFYKNRTSEAITPERLAELYSPTPFGRLPEVTEAYDRFIDYASFEAPALAPLDYHDLFYWEVRVARWAVLRIQEGDLSHRVALPFNHRGIIEALLALPLSRRAKKQPLLRFTDERLAERDRGSSGPSPSRPRHRRPLRGPRQVAQTLRRWHRG